MAGLWFVGQDCLYLWQGGLYFQQVKKIFVHFMLNWLGSASSRYLRYEKIKSMVKRCKLYLEYKRLEYELISVPFRQDQLCGFHDAAGDVNNPINVSMGFLGIVSAYS